MKEKHNSIKNWDELVDPAPDYHWNELYQQCVTEIGIQQSKRDQIIAFFIAVCSFVIPAVLEIENIGNAGRGACFFFLFFWAQCFVESLRGIVFIRKCIGWQCAPSPDCLVSSASA